LECNESALKP